MVDNDITKQAAVSLIESGIATIAEVAWLTGRSRELIRYWAGRPEHIDGLPAARAKHLQAEWKRVLKDEREAS